MTPLRPWTQRIASGIADCIDYVPGPTCALTRCVLTRSTLYPQHFLSNRSGRLSVGLALAGAGVGVEAQGVGGVAAWALGVQAPHMLQAVVVMTLRQMGRAVAQMRGRVSLMRPALSPRGANTDVAEDDSDADVHDERFIPLDVKACPQCQLICVALDASPHFMFHAFGVASC